MLETQRMLVLAGKDVPGSRIFSGRRHSELLQARLIEGFENYDIAHARCAPKRTGRTGAS